MSTAAITESRPLMTIREPFNRSFIVQVHSSRVAFGLCIAHGVSLIAISAVGAVFALLGAMGSLFRNETYKHMFQHALDGILQGCIIVPFGLFGVISPTAVEAFKRA